VEGAEIWGAGKINWNYLRFSVDSGLVPCYNVVMDATKPTSLRIPEEIIRVADEIAKSEERSRAQILVRTLRDGLLGEGLNGNSAGIKSQTANGGVGNNSDSGGRVRVVAGGEKGITGGTVQNSDGRVYISDVERRGAVKSGISTGGLAASQDLIELVVSPELAEHITKGHHKHHRGGGLNAEIATGGSAGVAADIVLAESKPSVRKGASYVNRKLLRGDAGSKVAAGKAAVEWFPNSKCPHGYMNSFSCKDAGGGCD
jgi:hypothetical protein